MDRELTYGCSRQLIINVMMTVSQVFSGDLSKFVQMGEHVMTKEQAGEFRAKSGYF